MENHRWHRFAGKLGQVAAFAVACWVVEAPAAEPAKKVEPASQPVAKVPASQPLINLPSSQSVSPMPAPTKPRVPALDMPPDDPEFLEYLQLLEEADWLVP